MKLTISSIALQNFKGLKNFQMDFEEGVTRISGRNGAGKTTLSDAISWCLFGKSSKAETQFGIKTRDENGVDIPHLDHSVELQMVINGESHTIKRVMKEKWMKPRGQEEEVLSGNYLEYFLDTTKVTKVDFEKWVFNLIGNDIFSLLTNPNHFANLHWQEQRNLLSKMVGEYSIEDVVGGDPLYDELLKELKGKQLADYRKHLSYEMRDIKKALELCPTKISALASAIPEKVYDYDKERELLDMLVKSEDEPRKKIAECKAGYSESAVKAHLRTKIEFTERRIDEIRKSKKNLARDAEDRYDVEVRDAKNTLNSCEETRQALLKKRTSLDTIINQTDESLKEYETSRAMGEDEWKMVHTQKFEIPEDISVCPTCGQPLPEEEAIKKIREAKEQFNLTRAEKLKKITEKAQELMADIESAKKCKESYIEELKQLDEQIQSANAHGKEAQARLKKIEEQSIPSFNMLLEEDTNYQSLVAELESLNKQMDADEVEVKDASLIAEYEKELKKIQEEESICRQHLAEEAQVTRLTKMLEDAKATQRQLSQQLTAMEKKEDVAIKLMNTMDEYLENKVNKMFSIAKFKLFKTQVDGITREPFCTVTYNGVEYKDLNTAMRLNVGIDIINAMSDYYNAYAPIIIDNAESVSEIMHSDSQQIQLYVSPNYEELTKW